MITLHIETPYASFRKSYARSYAETYSFPPPATVYGMLLSLVGEKFRAYHSGVKLAFAFAKEPRISTTLRRLSGYKYGVSRAPDFIETLCDLDFLCWVDSTEEVSSTPTLEQRVQEAIQTPEKVNRSGVLSLGLSDDAVDSISLLKNSDSQWHWLTPSVDGQIELPVWVDHVGAFYTRWQRYHFDDSPSLITSQAYSEKFVQIVDPR